MIQMIIFSSQAFSQSRETITIHSGEDVSVLYREIYRYPQFAYGRVYYKNGDSARGLLNYNLIMERVQFLDPKGDTLILEGDQPVDYVMIGNDRFFHTDKAFLELDTSLQKGMLVIKRRIKFADEQKMGAYGLPSSTHNIENKNRLSADYNIHQLRLARDLVFVKEELFYFGNAKKQFFLINRKNLLAEFPDKSGSIVDYLKIKNVNFKNRDEVKELLQFISN
jgi:hypothetical protein